MKRDVALALLGLSEDGLDAESITAAYKTAMRINHPDRYATNEQLRAHAEEQCKLINEARETLLSQLPNDEAHSQAESGNQTRPRQDSHETSREQTRSWHWRNDPKAQEGSSSTDPKAECQDQQNASRSEPGENDAFKHAAGFGSNPFGSTHAEAKEEHDEASKAPLLDSWHTSAGFSVLGVIASMLVLEFEQHLVFGAYLLMEITFMTLGIVYAAKLFPSLFGKNPDLKSSSGISFLNFFLACMPLGVIAGPIFGGIWNYSLSHRELGISRWVFIALNAAFFLWFLLAWFG